MNNSEFDFDLKEQLSIFDQDDYENESEYNHNQIEDDFNNEIEHINCEGNKMNDLSENEVCSLSVIFAIRSKKTITNEIQVSCQKYYETFCQETEERKVSRGRKKDLIGKLFDKFESWNPTKNAIIKKKPIKREYFNANVLRSFCKAIRYALKGNTPKDNKLAFDYHNTTERKIWGNFSDFVSEHKPFFDSKSSPKTLPSGSKSNQLSFNLEFMNGFFGDRIIRKALDILIELFFQDMQIERLQTIFRMSCCKNDGKKDHDFSCYIKWGLLQKFLKKEFFKSSSN